MNKIFILMTAAFLSCTGAFAQNASVSDPGPKDIFFQSAVVGPVGVTSGSAGVGMFSVEVPGNTKTVTGAPYTATVSTEMTQVLGDGNHIVNKTAASLARDSQGRTRREETMGMVGPWQVNGPTLVFINDPTSQTNYVLDPTKQTATVLKVTGFTSTGGPMGASVGYSTSTGGPMGANVGYMEKRIVSDQPEEAKTESLGVQVMEGVSVEGKRVTRTIPAGQIGNQQPIETTSEVWFSPDLQVVVMSKHNDPRFGETTYQLTGIQRVEPDHSLFEVPSGYTVKNMPFPMPPPMGADSAGASQFGIVTQGIPVGK